MTQLEIDKDRRASRAWRLSPAATAPADAEQHREHRAWRARNWVPELDAAETSEPDAFFNLFCSTCHYFLTENAVMMQMLVSPTSICFSTEQRPQNIELQDEGGKMPGMCECKVEDFACGCGARLGYHLVSPCDVCKEEGTKQRWFLCPGRVEAEPRPGPSRTPPSPRTPQTPRWAADEPTQPMGTKEATSETAQKHNLPQFGQEWKDVGRAEPFVLSDLNGRDKPERSDKYEKSKEAGKTSCFPFDSLDFSLGTEADSPRNDLAFAQRLAELERREHAISAKEEEVKHREQQLVLLQGKPLETRLLPGSGIRPDRDGVVQPGGQGESVPQGIQGIPIPSKPDLSDPQGRLEYSQRLIEKRKDLERWQQTLEAKNKALQELEKNLQNKSTGSGPLGSLGSLGMHIDPVTVVNAASVAGRAMAGAGFAASKVLVAVARPVFGVVRIAGSAAIQFGVSSYQAPVAYANEEAQERAMAQATALRRSRYYASMASSPTAPMATEFRDGSGVPPRPGKPHQSPQLWSQSRGSLWSPGWQASPIYPVSPAPHLPPVMEREGLVAWLRRNGGCGSRNHVPSYPMRYPTTR